MPSYVPIFAGYSLTKWTFHGAHFFVAVLSTCLSSVCNILVSQMTLHMPSWHERETVHKEIDPELIYLQTFCEPFPNDSAIGASLFILLMCTQKKTVPLSLFILTQFRIDTLLFTIIQPHLHLFDVTLPLIELFIACTIVFFGDFLYPATRALNAHSIKNTRSKTR